MIHSEQPAPTMNVFVRAVIACVLSIAAWLKAVELFSQGGIGAVHGLLDLGVVLVELTVVSLLLIPKLETAAWASCLILFALFAGVSGAKASSGVTDCGCFGSLSVSPKISLAIDAAVIALLVIFTPTLPSNSRRAVFGGSCFSAAMALFLTVVLSGPAQATVVLRPSEWVGRKVPILDQLVVPESMITGDWVLVILDPNCARCEAWFEQAVVDSRFSNNDAVLVLSDPQGIPLCSRITCPKPMSFWRVGAERRGGYAKRPMSCKYPAMLSSRLSDQASC